MNNQDIFIIFVKNRLEEHHQSYHQMKISLLTVGKTDIDWVRKGLETYSSRLSHYVPFTVCEIPELKNTYSVYFASWINNFEYRWPSSLKEPESEKV